VLLNVWTEIELGNLALELEQIEWTVGGKSQSSTAQRITAYLCAADTGTEPRTPEELKLKQSINQLVNQQNINLQPL